MGRVFLFVSRSVSNHALAFPLARLLVKTNPASSPRPLCRVANFHTHVSTPETLMPVASTMSLLPVISSDRSGCVQVIDRTVGAAPPGSVGGIDRLFYEDRFG